MNEKENELILQLKRIDYMENFYKKEKERLKKELDFIVLNNKV